MAAGNTHFVRFNDVYILRVLCMLLSCCVPLPAYCWQLNFIYFKCAYSICRNRSGFVMLVVNAVTTTVCRRRRRRCHTAYLSKQLRDV